MNYHILAYGPFAIYRDPGSEYYIVHCIEGLPAWHMSCLYAGRAACSHKFSVLCITVSQNIIDSRSYVGVYREVMIGRFTCWISLNYTPLCAYNNYLTWTRWIWKDFIVTMVIHPSIIH
jgi:hypothetical protein